MIRPEQIAGLFPSLQSDLQAIYTTGILPSQQIRELINVGYLRAEQEITNDQIQPASIDLRLGSVAYRVRASFLPGENSRVIRRVDELLMHELDLSRPTVLERGCVYIVPLMEEVSLPPKISGKANPKSTTGRLDIFTRLITDYGTEFERVKVGYKGKLYAEIVPRTFSVVVHEGTKLNQLRFVQRSPGEELAPSDTRLGKLDKEETLVYLDDEEPVKADISNGLWISVDLRGKNEDEVVGYKAKRNAPLIDLDKVSYYSPADFWEPIRLQTVKHLVLDPDDFYILISKQRIRVPPTYAAEMVAYDPSVGEFKIHYAGFFDPGFGYGKNDIKGTRAVLEVRSHEVPFVLEDGQDVGRLIYERLLTQPDKIYGTGIGSSYQSQGLSLSKQFKRD